MVYSFRLLFAFVSMCRSRQAHFFLRVFIYITCVYMCTTRWHIPTGEMPINKQIGKCWRKKNSNKRNSLHKRNWHLFRPRPELLSHTLSPIWHPGDSPVLCGSTQSCMHVYPILRKSPAWSSSWKTTELRSSSVFWLYCCSTWHAASSSHATDLQAYAYAPSSS